MCGRFVVSYTYEELMHFLEDSFSIFDFTSNVEIPNYNVAPGTPVISIINDGYKNRAGVLEWGFLPAYSNSKSKGLKLINARGETIHEKVSFKDSFYTKRCIILANGYYEWKRENQMKIPMYIYHKTNKMIAFAGIWNKHFMENGEAVFTCAIVTTKSSKNLASIHDRMPVILNLSNAKEWIDPNNTDYQKLKHIITENLKDELNYYQVSDRVNNVRNNDSDLLHEVTSTHALTLDL